MEPPGWILHVFWEVLSLEARRPTVACEVSQLIEVKPLLSLLIPGHRHIRRRDRSTGFAPRTSILILFILTVSFFCRILPSPFLLLMAASRSTAMTYSHNNEPHGAWRAWYHFRGWSSQYYWRSATRDRDTYPQPSLCISRTMYVAITCTNLIAFSIQGIGPAPRDGSFREMGDDAEEIFRPSTTFHSMALRMGRFDDHDE
jgi:hypothetical protein